MDDDQTTTVPRRNKAKAFLLGFKDGWAQPYDLCFTHNVEHLGSNEDFMVQEWLDRGATWGQRLRSPRHHQEV